MKETLYVLTYCPCINDEGVTGLPGPTPQEWRREEEARSAQTSSLHIASHSDDHSPSGNRSAAGESTRTDYEERMAGEPEPSVSISLDGKEVCRAPLGDSLCIPSEAVVQLVDRLTVPTQGICPQGKEDMRDQAHSISLSVERGSRGTQLHILSLPASRVRPSSRKDPHQ